MSLIKSNARSTITLLALLMVGFAGNYFSLPLFFGVEALFGSIAALAVMRLYGIGWGVASICIASSYTVLVLGDPYLFASKLVEVVAVGLVLRGTNRNLLLVDGIFWLLFGIPLLWALYFWGAQAGESVATVLTLKVGVNGIVNALFASMLVQALTLLKLSGRMDGKAAAPLSQVLFNLLVSSALVPALVISITNAHYELNVIETVVRDDLEAASGEILRLVEQRQADAAKDGVLDATLILAGRDTSGRLSDDAFVADLIRRHAREGKLDLTFLDRAGRVVLTSRRDLVRGQAYDRLSNGHLPVAGQVYLWKPEGNEKNRRGAVLPWEQQLFVEELPLKCSSTPSLMLEASFKPYYPFIFDTFVARMVFMLGLIFVAFAMGLVLSRWLTKPLARLAEASTNLKLKLVDGATENLPPSPIVEMDALITNFREMSDSLRASYRMLLANNELLEQRVAERTQELSTANERMLTEIAGRKKFEHALAIHARDLEKTTAELESQKFALDQHSIVAITDKSGVITYANDKFCKVSRYSREELLGRNHRIVKSGFHSKAFFDELWATISAGKVWHGEVCDRRKDGSLYWVDTTIVPFVDSRGEPYQYVSIRTDITERKAAEEGLVRAKDAAEQASRAKSEFLSRMSHELRTPLNAIIGFTQLLESDPSEPLTPSQKENVNHILGAGWHLLDLINEVLDLARIEAGRMQLYVEKVEIAPLARECVDLVAAMASERQIAVVDLISNCNCHWVRADRMRLKQVLLNLISNAVKYNRDQGNITLDCVLRPDGTVRISVADTGMGVPADKLDQLFQPFSRLDADKTEIEGTGAGLAISKRLVELMGGEIGVDSVPGEGSTFWFVLRNASDEEGPVCGRFEDGDA